MCVKAIKTGNFKIVNKIVTSDKNIIKETSGTIILTEAVKTNNLEMVCLLIDLGAKVNDEYRILYDHETPLAIAASQGNLEMVKLLVEAGAIVNIPLKYPEYWTPLMCGVSRNNFDVVKFLVEAGAAVNEIRDGGNFALAIAAHPNSQEIFNYLAPLTNIKLRKQLEN